MNSLDTKKIFATIPAAEFVGRATELRRLVDHARSSNELVLLAQPRAGASELLRQVADRLFVEQQEIIPFYFEIRESDGTVHDLALRFVREFLIQTVAFRRRDAAIIRSAPSIGDLADLAAPADGHWIEQVIETFSVEVGPQSERAFVRHCFNTPLRAADNGARSLVMIDGLQNLAGLQGGEAMIENLVDIFRGSGIPVVFSGYRRFLFGKMPFLSIPLGQLSFADAGKLAENMAARSGVTLSDQTRDLIAIQIDGDPGQMNDLITAAAEKKIQPDNFERVEQVYTNEIFGGRIGRSLNRIFDHISPDRAVQARVVRALSHSLATADGKTSITSWNKETGLSGAALERLLDALHWNEIVNISDGAVRVDSDKTVLADYVNGRSALAVAESRALVVGDALTANICRAPVLMSRFYKKLAALGLRDLLRAFDGELVSQIAIDYGRFKAQLKGASEETALATLGSDDAKIALPRVVYTANTNAIYPRLGEIAEPERSAVAIGFDAQGDEVVILTVEIDSKLEADRELTEFWCDRLEMVAVHCGFAEYRLWLITPEGFDSAALVVLAERNAYGSSRKQVALLSQLLNAAPAAKELSNAEEYEIVVPMGEDTEMISAHAVEDIAKRHDLPAKMINQIKTALVEACINAAEHSLSPDRKIHQKFTVDGEKLTITVSNRGLRLTDKKLPEDVNTAERRGWGLKLMQGLMDDVRLEQTDDGTSVTMIKYLSPDLAIKSAA